MSQLDPSGAAEHRSRLTWRETAAWLALFVILRALIVVGEYPELHRIDELYAGAAALELLAGRALPLPQSAWDPYSGGSIVVILAVAAITALVGPSLLIIKGVALTFSGATMVLWVALVSRLFGRRAARLLAALLVFAPPWPARLGVMAWGNHAESALPTVAALLALAGLADGGRHPRFLAFAAGALAGLAVFFSLMGLLTVASVAILWLGVARARPGLWRTTLVPLAAGTAAGLIPALVFFLALDLAGLAILGRAVRPSPTAAALKLWQLGSTHLPDYLAAAGALPGRWAFAAAVLGGLGWCGWQAVAMARRRQLPRAGFLVVPAALFGIAYAVSGFFIGPASGGLIAYHYLAPMTPCLFASASVAIARLPRRAAYAAVAILAAPAAEHALRCAGSADPSVLGYRGGSYLAYGWHAHLAAGGRLELATAELTSIPAGESRDAAFAGLAVGFAIEQRVAFWGRDETALAANIDSYIAETAVTGGERDAFVERLAHVLGTGDRVRLEPARARLLIAHLEQRWGGVAAPVVRAVVLAAEPQVSDAAELTKLVQGLPPAYRSAGFEALGGSAARRARDGRPRPSRPAEPTAASAFDRGYGFEFAWGQLTAPPGAEPMPTAGPHRRGNAFREGVVRALTRLEPDDPVRRAAVARRAGLEMSANPQ